jgi:hypothetical protein
MSKLHFSNMGGQTTSALTIGDAIFGRMLSPGQAAGMMRIEHSICGIRELAKRASKMHVVTTSCADTCEL